MVREELADRLKKQEALYLSRAQADEMFRKQLQGDITQSRTQIGVQQEKITADDEEIHQLRAQLDEARQPSAEHREELRALRTQISLLEAAKGQSELRARTIEARYGTGDLVSRSTMVLSSPRDSFPMQNDEEKAFISRLVRSTQAIHEQELVASRNELRRVSRDMAIEPRYEAVDVIG